MCNLRFWYLFSFIITIYLLSIYFVCLLGWSIFTMSRNVTTCYITAFVWRNRGAKPDVTHARSTLYPLSYLYIENLCNYTLLKYLFVVNKNISMCWMLFNSSKTTNCVQNFIQYRSLLVNHQTFSSEVTYKKVIPKKLFF